jgi:hypothetical protein
MINVAICLVVDPGLFSYVLISGNVAIYITFQMAFIAGDFT